MTTRSGLRGWANSGLALAATPAASPSSSETAKPSSTTKQASPIHLEYLALQLLELRVLLLGQDGQRLGLALRPHLLHLGEEFATILAAPWNISRCAACCPSKMTRI